MELTTIAIGAASLIGLAHAFEWVKIRRMSPEERRLYLEKNRRDAEERARLKNRNREAFEKFRDADEQASPFRYKIGRHGNEALAIRYGIANQTKTVVKGYYYAKGGKKDLDERRDKVRYDPAETIRVRKLKKLGESKYLVALTDFRDREAVAIIEVGTDHIKTFYPKSDEWFTKHAQLEEVLKGNGAFTLKELARFHIDKAVT